MSHVFDEGQHDSEWKSEENDSSDTVGAPGTPSIVADPSITQQEPADESAVMSLSPSTPSVATSYQSARRNDPVTCHPLHQDSVTSLQREADAMTVTPRFFQREYDTNLDIFEEPPQISVLNAKVLDSWTNKHVEYEVELKYKTFKWRVDFSKSSVYGLWFYVKKRPQLLHGMTSNSSHSHIPTLRSPTESNSHGFNRHKNHIHLPQLRKFFLANADSCVRPDMVRLVEEYLRAVVRIPRLLRTSYLLSLFQVSNSTFDDVEGRTSVREGWLRVRYWMKGNRENVRINRAVVNCDNECVNCVCVVKRVHLNARKWRWVSLKRTCLAVYDSIQAHTAVHVFLFDSKFSIERGLEAVGSIDELIISNSTYVLQLEAKSKHIIAKWASQIRDIAVKCPWSQPHRDDSFAVPRHPHRIASYAQWYVDGEDAYKAIHDGILSAKREIYIQGWWICPKIHLLRPAVDYPDSRLDLLIERKAKEGVKVYVLMYKEVAMALTLNSLYSKTVLNSLHANIQVLRDPDFIIKNLGMWSHHEKIVCIDQSQAFVGGLDLCFGRWDKAEHPLYDQDISRTEFLGKDYSNPRIKDFVDVQFPEVDLMDRERFPRMPWHDCHCQLTGQPARDVGRHFIQRWNYTIATRRKSEKLRQLVPMREFEANNEGVTSSKRLLSHRLQKTMRKLRLVNHFRKSASLKSVAETMKELANENRPQQSVSDAISPHSQAASIHRPASDHSGFHHGLHKSTSPNKTNPGSDEESETLQSEIGERMPKKLHACSCQILRSISYWSGGCPTEHSIQNAYLRLISSANHFIYIENQFFISGLEGDHLCRNRIANALVERIRRAAANNEIFRVMVIMPLLPAFPGQPDDKDASSLRGVLHWQYRSICRGEHSIYHTLFRELDDPFEYIAFYGLRTYFIKDGQPQTEEVYIHSKIMIVDDRSCIIGSANINERSMLGDRDSEIAVSIDDTEFNESVRIAGGKTTVGKFCHSFRMRLFQEHFGLTPGSDQYIQYQDPVNDDTWFTMQEQAMRNSQIYESVFMCLPTDSITKFAQLHKPPIDIKTKAERDNANGNAVAKTDESEHLEDARADAAIFGQFSAENDEMWKDKETIADEVFNVHPSDTLDPQEKQGKEPDATPDPLADNSVGRVEERVAGEAMRGNMRESEVIQNKKEELQGIQGTIVYFPLKFLADELLEPKLYPAELFQ